MLPLTLAGSLSGYKASSVADENGCLTVLHNRNHMVKTFGNSEWVIQAAGKVQSKSASCAGMTAHLVLLAQTCWISKWWKRQAHARLVID